MSNLVKSASLNEAQYLDRIQQLLTQSTDRLSSGSRITSPADDPAGVGEVSKYTAQNLRQQSALTNIQNGQSLVQATTGDLSTLNQVVTRMSELATLAQDPMKNATDIANYQSEFQSLQQQLRDTIGGTTAEIGGTADISQPAGMFNGFTLFGPNSGGTVVTTGDSSGDTITIPETNLRTGSLLALMQQDSSGNFTLSVTSASALSDATAGITQISNATASVASAGTAFDIASANLTQTSQDLTNVIGSIQNVDVAAESTRQSKLQTLSQAATAMLAQANEGPQAVLGLLTAQTIPGAQT